MIYAPTVNQDGSAELLVSSQPGKPPISFIVKEPLWRTLGNSHFGATIDFGEEVSTGGYVMIEKMEVITNGIGGDALEKEAPQFDVGVEAFADDLCPVVEAEASEENVREAGPVLTEEEDESNIDTGGAPDQEQGYMFHIEELPDLLKPGLKRLIHGRVGTLIDAKYAKSERTTIDFARFEPSDAENRLMGHLSVVGDRITKAIKVRYRRRIDAWRAVAIILGSGQRENIQDLEETMVSSPEVRLDLRQHRLTVAASVQYLVHLAFMGIGRVFLILDDEVVAEGKSFGLSRGLYSMHDLKEIRQAAHDLGIEIVPEVELLKTPTQQTHTVQAQVEKLAAIFAGNKVIIGPRNIECGAWSDSILSHVLTLLSAARLRPIIWHSTILCPQFKQTQSSFEVLYRGEMPVPQMEHNSISAVTVGSKH